MVSIIHRIVILRHVPYPRLPDIAGGALVEKVADLLQLTPPRAGVVQQVAELARIGLDLHVVLVMSRVAVEHQDLVLRPAFLPDCVHCLMSGEAFGPWWLVFTASSFVASMMLDRVAKGSSTRQWLLQATENARCKSVSLWQMLTL